MCRTILARTPNLNWLDPLDMDFIWARSSLARAEEEDDDEGGALEEEVLLPFLSSFLALFPSTVGMAMALRLKASRSRSKDASI